MFNDLEDDLFRVSDALEAFNELERNTNKAILAQRTSERLDIRTKVIIRPANPSERTAGGVEVVTVDISNGGCMALSSKALLPGDYYWMCFEEDAVRIGSLLGRCLRCRFVQEDAFEIGFRFMQDVPLKSLLV